MSISNIPRKLAGKLFIVELPHLNSIVFWEEDKIQYIESKPGMSGSCGLQNVAITPTPEV